MNQKLYSAVLACCFILLTVASITTAQETAGASTTPAPSKTPTMEVALETNNGVGETATPSALMKPFTQEDLSILTGNVQRPNGIVWFENELYTACSGDWTLYRLNDTTGDTITFVFGIRNTHNLLAETTNNGFNLWIPDFDTNTLYRVDQNRAAPTIIATGFDSPQGIAQFNEQFLITNLRSNTVDIVTREGITETLLEGLKSPTGIAVKDTTVYIANNGSARRSIEWFTIANNIASEPHSLVSGLQNVTTITLADDGYLYFTYSLSNRGVVGRIDPLKCVDSGCTSEQVEIVVYTELPAPLAGLTISPDGRLFVHSIYHSEIYWVQLDFGVSTTNPG